jgi:mannose-6-phosphate isomerase-like protein (cupin superfamily)
MHVETSRKEQVFQVPSTIVAYRAVAADTGGAFSLFEGRVAPHQGPPLHTHPDDEAFLILEGSFEFQVGDQRLQRGLGEFAFVPRHTPHAFRNLGEVEGRLLMITMPAGPHEGFFAEAGEPQADFAAPFATEPPDIGQLMAVGKHHGFEILGPPMS